MTAQIPEDPQAKPKRRERRGNAVGLRPGIIPGETAFERGDHVELAEHTLRKLGPNPITYDVGRVWRYSPVDGVWSAIDDELVETTVAGFAGAYCERGQGGCVMIKANTMIGTRHVIRARLMAEPSRITFDHAPAGMAFRNGFVTVEGGEAKLLPNAPMRLARHRYEFDFNPSAPRPQLDQFLFEVFADQTEEERRLRIDLLQEFLGACLVGDATRYQRYLVMFAPGGNGKSELLRICRACFPAGTVTSLEPQKWNDDKHAATLEGVRANFVDEMPDNEIMGGHNVKRVVTGEPLTARRVFKDAITFSPRAGHMFATNSPIQSSDYSDGFWERPLVLVLSRSFRKSPERRLEAAKGIVETELAGIIAWAIEGACRAQRQKGYTEPSSSAKTLLEWRDDNDQVRGFVADQPITGRWKAETLYEAYREWAKANGCAPMSSTKFGRRIVANGLAKRDRDAAGRHYMPAEDT